MPASSPQNSPPVYKSDLVHRMLLAIFSGAWKPGDRLREVDLAQSFGVSRTPVREALQEIAGIGLIELKPNCGAVVAEIGMREIEEIYEVRALLESEATRLACPRLRQGDVAALIAQSERLVASTRRDRAWSLAAWEVDRALHHMMAQNCSNRRLTREVQRYSSFVQIIRETLGNQNHVQDLALQEHLEVLQALRRNQPDKAAAMMRKHVLSAGAAAAAALQPKFAARPSRRASLPLLTGVA